MKLVFTEWWRNWRGSEPQLFRPTVLDLENEKHRFFLVVSLGNGNFEEGCFECESIEAHEAICGLLTGTARAERVIPSPESEKFTLFRHGYDTFVQGADAYFFVNPSPRPELFLGADLAHYAKEFKERG
jgi:hypothetical protein